MKTLMMLMLSAMVAMPASAAKLYKWVDENGKVHYSDKVPPEAIRNEHKQLNEQGVVKETVEKDLTDEQKVERIEEFKKQRELEAQKQREAEALAAEKNKILMSYSSADQITRLKQERISALERNISTAKENLVIQEKNHNDLLSRAADKERSGEVVSEVFLEQIKQVKNQIEYQKQYIIDKTEEITATQEKYDSELAKYLMFTGQSDGQ